jgi:hypothetical protein
MKTVWRPGASLPPVQIDWNLKMTNVSTKSPRPERRRNDSGNRARADRSEGFSKERLALLRDIKEQIRLGFYNTDPVLEDLSHAFTKTVDSFI